MGFTTWVKMDHRSNLIKYVRFETLWMWCLELHRDRGEVVQLLTQRGFVYRSLLFLKIAWRQSSLLIKLSSVSLTGLWKNLGTLFLNHSKFIKTGRHSNVDAWYVMLTTHHSAPNTTMKWFHSEEKFNELLINMFHVFSQHGKDPWN